MRHKLDDNRGKNEAEDISLILPPDEQAQDRNRKIEPHRHEHIPQVGIVRALDRR